MPFFQRSTLITAPGLPSLTPRTEQVWYGMACDFTMQCLPFKGVLAYLPHRHLLFVGFKSKIIQSDKDGIVEGKFRAAANGMCICW